MISIDLSGAFPNQVPLLSLESPLKQAHTALTGATCSGSDFLGWLHWPKDYDKAEYARVRQAAQKIQAQSQVLLVIGIGGSYLGARAVLEALISPFYNNIAKDTPDIYFVGNNVSSSYLTDILRLIEGRDFSIHMISKSGTTTEPAIAFRLFRNLLVEKYGETDARARIYVTTDKQKGALKALCDAENYETFVIPDDIGGRYSVFTSVGLLPLAVAGIDTDALLGGARKAQQDLSVHAMQNPAWQYAAARNILYNRGKTVEMLAVYEPCLRFVGEWWKQLFGESEGKEGKGLFPASVEYTADLHSMGQYMQEGLRNLLETVIVFDATPEELLVPHDKKNTDGLNFLSGQTLSHINTQAAYGTFWAHVDGGVPNLVIHVPKRDAYHMGFLLYFFMLSCGLSGLLLGVNPFNQPGVEAYKNNMFALLGKPGYEELQRALQTRAL